MAADSRWLRWAPALVVLVALVLSYFPLFTGQGVVVTDDSFTSDITNGEWPLRVEIGRLVREGHWPVWTRRLFGGSVLIPALPGTDPLGIALFALLPPVAAINAFLLAMLFIAGTGAAKLSRALGASPAGASVAALGFVFSGYLVCQLKHTGIMSAVIWVPWGCWALLEALRLGPGTSKWAMAKPLGWFSLFYGLQWLAGFAQAAYISTLLYAPWGLFLVVTHRQGLARAEWLKRVVAFAVAGVGGVLIGAVQLLPTLEFTTFSDRSTGVTVDWVTRWNYWLPNLWTFVVPYFNGDFGNGTYVGRGIFWEDYSYAGLVTLVLAVVALRWPKAPWVRFWWLAAVLALLVVLGKHTPVFSVMFHLVPGMKFFRFPTRFLVLVHLALSVLAGLGLTRAEAWAVTRFAAPQTGRLVGALAWLVVGASFADWLAPPASVSFVRENAGDFRTYSMLAKNAHSLAGRQAKGWANLEPFYAVRDMIQPNANLLWGVTSAGGYVGLLTKEAAVLWGSSQEASRVDSLAEAASEHPEYWPELARVLRAFSVKYVVAPFAQGLLNPITLGTVVAYELDAPAPRFHLAHRLRGMASNDAAFAFMRSAGFEPAVDTVLMGEDVAPVVLDVPADASVKLLNENAVSSELEVSSTKDVLLVNTESYFASWVAEVDGARTDVFRANINQRAVKVPAGTHRVRFEFESPTLRLGALLSVAGLLGVALVWWLSARKLRASLQPARTSE